MQHQALNRIASAALEESNDRSAASAAVGGA